MGRCITALWVCMTILFTCGVCFSFLSPVWFENKTQRRHNTLLPTTKTSGPSSAYDPVALGMIRFCNREELADDVIRGCRFFTSFKEMPSIAWTVCAIVYAVGCVFFMISVVMALVSVCVGVSVGEKMKIVAAYVQITAVGLLAIGVLLFPLGLDSSFARDVCGLEAKMFAADKCQVAWGYVLAIMTVSLTIFCPILGKYSTESKDNYKGVTNTGTYSDYDYQKSEIASLTTSSTSTRSKVMTTV